MLARNDLEKMAQDAKLALSRSYGYPQGYRTIHVP
jgi:hypothetical protein